MGRFINADALVSTGQGVQGNNMFAYCLNNPVVLADSSGTAAHIGFSADGQIHDAPWRIGSPGGGCWPQDIHYSRQNYSSASEKFYTVMALRFVRNNITDFGHNLQDAYTKSYMMYHEAKILEAQLMIDMFDTPEDIERSIDIIESTLGFEIAVYEVAVICVTNPTAGAVLLAAGGAIWGIRALYRACM